MFLTDKDSKRCLKAAENARNNRLDIVKALSHGQINRRDLVRWGLVGAGGALLPIPGLHPMVGATAGASVPTGTLPSPGLTGLAFTQPMLRFQELDRKPFTNADGSYNTSALTGPKPSRLSNQTDRYVVDAALGGGLDANGNPITGPLEGRPPGEGWAHQAWGLDDANGNNYTLFGRGFSPRVAVEASQMQARDNVRPDGTVIPYKFHPALASQNPNSMWTFDGTVPPKLVKGRYGEPLLFRHWNRLPADVTQNNGFGRHTITTHEHNGHHGAENDGFTGAFFFPGQYYDYHWPIVHAGFSTINTAATDPRCGRIDDNGNLVMTPGDWHETMSTHWFHDHMFSFTAQNVYKGNAAMFNIYSAIDTGYEGPGVNDPYNLRLPSGTKNPWGNVDYDVNLLISDKAWDSTGQLFFDIFNLDGFVGDVMTVNFAYKPYFEVEARKYRFRILNASVSRFFKLCLSDGSPIIQIGNDGNLLPQPVTLTQLDEQGIAERYDIVIDFSRYAPGSKVWMVNLCEHQSGLLPSADRSLSDALNGKSSDPCVGKFLEFRIIPITGPDLSRVPSVLIPNPDLSRVPIARTRTFTFGRSDGTDALPWTIKTDNGSGLAADFSRVSALPKQGTREIWTLQNGGGGWDHPIHIHFEEGQVLARNGSSANVPPWEKGRKDVYRLRPSGSITVTLQFREFMGTYVEHCHNTVHEDNAMLLRWDLTGNLVPLPTPNPTPTGVDFNTPTTKVPTA